MTADKIRSKHHTIGGTRFVLNSMRDDRHFGTRFEWVGNQRIAVSDPEKTIIDMFYSQISAAVYSTQRSVFGT